MPEDVRAARPALALVIDDGRPVGRDDDDDRGGGGGGPPAGRPGGEVVAVPASDDALAVELSRELGLDWRCGMPGSEWFEWGGQRWLGERTQRVFDISRQVCRRYAADWDLSDKLGREVTSTGKAYAAVKFAGADRRHATELVAFDRNPWLLNTPSGIVDLRSGQPLAHDRDALMSKMTAAGPEGECPTWRKFLREATGGDDDLIGFLQRWAGYCLTGVTHEEMFVFLHGPPGTGKSTYQWVVATILGDYAARAPMNTFVVAMGERHPTELAQFKGVRLVVANETQEGQRWDEARLSELSDGTPITARYMRGDFFTFDNQLKLLFAGNYRPRLRAVNGGLRRRLLLVKFNHKPAKRDDGLKDKLREEFGGILRWMIEGEVLRQHHGLRPPSSVMAATEDYFRTEDTIGRWIEERCERAPGHRALPAQLYRDFISWAATVGEAWRPSMKQFSEKLDDVPGLERGTVDLGRDAAGGRLRSNNGLHGIKLRFADAELPFDGVAGRGAASGAVRRATFSPPAPGDDPGDEYPR